MHAQFLNRISLRAHDVHLTPRYYDPGKKQDPGVEQQILSPATRQSSISCRDQNDFISTAEITLVNEQSSIQFSRCIALNICQAIRTLKIS